MNYLERQANDLLSIVKQANLGVSIDDSKSKRILTNLLLRSPIDMAAINPIEQLNRPDSQTKEELEARKKKYMRARVLLNTLAGAGGGAMLGAANVGGFDGSPRSNFATLLGAGLGGLSAGGRSYLTENYVFDRDNA